MVFLLVGIMLAFIIHFGFSDFVKTESSTPTIKPPVAGSEVGSSERVRAGSFERAAERTARRQHVARVRARAAAAAAAARAAATRPAAASTQRSSSSVRSTPSTSRPAVSSPSPAARSTPKPTPSRGGGGGGGQSFDDSG